ncbi:MAG: NmrA family NAD(P)-binding protein, partial [Solirubrobacteraceae bacterium]
PDDFGTHSMATPYGVSAHFDAKKRFQEQLEASRMPWTVIYPGGIAEYFVPNLRPPATVYAWGERTLRFPIHTLRDIGAITARAATDPRTANRAVQLHANLVTTDELIARLRANWPDHSFVLDERSSEELEHLHRHGNADPGNARLSEREIMGISYANHVLGTLGVPDDPRTLDAAELYPEHRFEDPLELLADRGFVFGSPEPRP